MTTIFKFYLNVLTEDMPFVNDDIRDACRNLYCTLEYFGSVRPTSVSNYCEVVISGPDVNVETMKYWLKNEAKLTILDTIPNN